MNPDDVTLIVPCYNVADTLSRVLSAVDRLDPSPARVLCVDDGSSDGTRQILESHDSADLVVHGRNRGLGATLNTALAHTNTPGLAKVDADIVVESDWLGRLCALCAEHDAALVQGRFEEQVTTTADRWRSKHPSPTFPAEPQRNTPINGSNILCRVDALEAVDGWDETYDRAFDDIDLMLRLRDEGYRIQYSPDVVTTHVRTDTWREVLSTAWAYHYDALSGREAPTQLRGLFKRLPGILYRSGACISTDLKQAEFDILWISLLRPFYHVMWDIEHVRNNHS